MALFKKSEIARLSELLAHVKKLRFEVITQPAIRLDAEIREAEKTDYEAIELLLELLNASKIDKQASISVMGELERIYRELKQQAEGKIDPQQILEHILKTLEYTIETEKKYLYKEPGLEVGGYMRLAKVMAEPQRRFLLNKGVLEVRGSKLFFDGRQIGGATLRGDRILLRAEHYSTKSALSAIVSGKTLEVSPEDPYSYLVESGRLARKTQQEIKHALGIKKNITGRVTFFVAAPISRTWIKCNPGKPCRFAVEGELNIKPIKRGGELIIELF